MIIFIDGGGGAIYWNAVVNNMKCCFSSKKKNWSAAELLNTPYIYKQKSETVIKYKTKICKTSHNKHTEMNEYNEVVNPCWNISTKYNTCHNCPRPVVPLIDEAK
jgi:hypothetical protein